MPTAKQKIAARLAKAFEAFRAGDVGRARKHCGAALRLAPEHVDALHLLATIEARAGSYARAEALIRRAVARRPDAAPLANTMGNILKRQGDAEGAEAAYRRALELAPEFAEASGNLSNLLLASGRAGDAGEHAARAVRQRPESARAHNDLGRAQRALGEFSAAAASFRRATELAPDYVAAWVNRGAAQLQSGLVQESLGSLNSALELDPRAAGALLQRGIARRVAGQPELALADFERALAHTPGAADALAERGSALQLMGRYDAAEVDYRAALRASPNHPAALAGLAELCEWRGNYQAGLQLLETATAGGAAPGVVWLAQARLQRRAGDNDAALASLAQAAAAPAASAWLSRQLHFTFGDVLDATGRYDEAFAHYVRANAAAPAAAAARVDWDALLRAAAAPVAQQAVADDGADLVFIVGMPRAGTSLLEQMLGQHPAVLAAGELAALGQLAQALRASGNPWGIERLAAADIPALAAAYRAQLPARNDAQHRVTDKMPLNFLYLPLLRQLFPAARVVHCRRDPVDTCLSCFFQDFADPQLGFSGDLTALGEYYRRYRLLLDCWERADGLALHGVDYERLVVEPEPVMRDLLDFLDLAWDPAVVDTGGATRDVFTASHAQVRRPLYRSSVDRRRHYAGHLEPLHQALNGGAEP